MALASASRVSTHCSFVSGTVYDDEAVVMLRDVSLAASIVGGTCSSFASTSSTLPSLLPCGGLSATLNASTDPLFLSSTPNSRLPSVRTPA